MGLRTLVMLDKSTILAVNYINFGSIFYTQKVIDLSLHAVALKTSRRAIIVYP